MTPSTNLADAVNGLDSRHVDKLMWFDQRNGHTTGYPEPLEDGTFLVSRPKGIYKPKGTDLALSVRQTIASKYPDQDPVFREDGSWSYL